MPLFPPDRLAAWTNGRWTASPSELVRGFNPDSRTVQPGQVFVALRTEKRDGHDFLARAAEALRAEGVAWLDLGSVDTEAAPGLARFKLGTGAELRRLGIGTLLVSHRPAVLAAADRIVELAPAQLSHSAGQL